MLLTASLGLLIGIPLGILIQRGGFCMHSGFRQVLRGEPSASFLAYLLALVGQMVVVNALAGSQLIRVPTVPLAWAASIVGGLTFGFGMVWAKGWATSIWSRVGTGNLGAGMAVLGFAIGGLLTERGLFDFLIPGLVQPSFSALHTASLPTVLGVRASWVILAAVVCIVFLLRVLPKPSASAGTWAWHKTGLTLAALGILAWLAGSPSGWHWGLSMTGPSRSLLTAVLDQSWHPVTWGAFMLLGVPLGSFLSAKGTASWQVPEVREFPQRFLGGLLMGFGGTLAAGCNIGNALTGLSILSVNSFVATASIILGLALAVRVQEYIRHA